MTGKDARGFVRVQAEAEKALYGSNLYRKILTWMLVQEDAEEEALLRGRVKSRSWSVPFFNATGAVLADAWPCRSLILTTKKQNKIDR